MNRGTAVMRRVCRTDDRGSAIVEFCYLGVLMLVPLVYLLLTVLELQKAGFATTGAAREAGRAVAASSGADLHASALSAARIAVRDYGFELAEGDVRLSCGADRGCTGAPGEDVQVEVRLQVRLTAVPGLAGGPTPVVVPVSATYTEHLGRFAGPAR